MFLHYCYSGSIQSFPTIHLFPLSCWCLMLSPNRSKTYFLQIWVGGAHGVKYLVAVCPKPWFSQMGRGLNNEPYFLMCFLMISMFSDRGVVEEAAVKNQTTLLIDRHVNVPDGGLSEVTYTYLRPHRRHSGDYRCVAENSEGRAYVDFKIEVEWCEQTEVIVHS